MNTGEPIRKRRVFTWFKFFPSDWIEIVSLPDKECAKRFRDLVLRLLSNEAPEGTKEAEMIAESKGYSDKQRDRVLNRWTIPLPSSDNEVIAFAENFELNVEYALEWAKLNLKERKGKDQNGETIKNWKKACLAYCKSMEEKRCSRN